MHVCVCLCVRACLCVCVCGGGRGGACMHGSPVIAPGDGPQRQGHELWVESKCETVQLYSSECRNRIKV